MLTDPIATAHEAPDAGLPPFTWHVLSQGDVGAMMPLPCPVSRQGAFDAARTAIAAGRRVRVEMVQRNTETGGALAISDVTGLVLALPGLLDSDDAVTLADHPAPRCGPDRRAEAEALAEDLRQIDRIEKLHKLRSRCCDSDLSGLQGGAVLRRWLGLDSILTRILRALRIGGAA
ncbi:MAG TPA: hypothetical protein DD444_04165 [Citreicella sp.]|jgi:hypothetical protein|nr:hypothetical protein [Citreicella sp.]